MEENNQVLLEAYIYTNLVHFYQQLRVPIIYICSTGVNLIYSPINIIIV